MSAHGHVASPNLPTEVHHLEDMYPDCLWTGYFSSGIRSPGIAGKQVAGSGNLGVQTGPCGTSHAPSVESRKDPLDSVLGDVIALLERIGRIQLDKEAVT